MFSQLLVQSSQHRWLHRDVISGITSRLLLHLRKRKNVIGCLLLGDLKLDESGVYLLLFVLQVRVSPQRDVFGHRQHDTHQLIHCGLKQTG